MIKAPISHGARSFLALNNSRQTVPRVTIQNERQLSAVKIASRICLRLVSIGFRYSAGMFFIAAISDEETKSEKNNEGAKANNRATPPVRAKLM